MAKFTTIPYMLPELGINDFKEGKFDEVILFVLAVFGSHKLEELQLQKLFILEKYKYFE
jgi:hypothetical protein